MGWGRHELGAAFVPILLAIRPPDASLAAAPDLPEMPAGIEVIIISADSDDAQTMIIAASKIRDVLKKRRSKFMHYAAAAAQPIADTAVLAAYATVSSTTASARLSVLVVRALARLVTKLGWNDRRNRKEQPQPETPIPDSESLKIVTSQIDMILVTFRELAHDAHEVAEHELRFLVEEFRSGHFTACAMRGGRCLESMVYELSRRWNIELRDSTFGVLNEVRKALNGVETALGNFESAEDFEREKLSKKLDAMVVGLNSCTMSAFMAVKAVQASTAELKKADGGPRPVIALLKRMRSQYGKLDGVAKNLNEVLPSPGRDSPVERIIGNPEPRRSCTPGRQTTGD